MKQGIEADVAHRPWPFPNGPWVMFQSWRQLLFAHWPLPLERLRPLVPPELELDEFDGVGWVGLTPFRLTQLHPRFLPPLPGLAHFPEMNLRTYVRYRGMPGIFFFSLDADHRLAVLAARLGYGLPYHAAAMRVRERRGWIEYESRRKGEAEVEFRGSYRPVGPQAIASPGTLEYFLAERYAFFRVFPGGTILIGEIHHHPWKLHRAEATIERNTIAHAARIELPDRPPLLHYSARQDTLIWPPRLQRSAEDPGAEARRLGSGIRES